MCVYMCVRQKQKCQVQCPFRAGTNPRLPSKHVYAQVAGNTALKDSCGSVYNLSIIISTESAAMLRIVNNKEKRRRSGIPLISY